MVIVPEAFTSACAGRRVADHGAVGAVDLAKVRRRAADSGRVAEELGAIQRRVARAVHVDPPTVVQGGVARDHAILHAQRGRFAENTGAVIRSAVANRQLFNGCVRHSRDRDARARLPAMEDGQGGTGAEQSNAGVRGSDGDVLGIGSRGQVDGGDVGIAVEDLLNVPQGGLRREAVVVVVARCPARLGKSVVDVVFAAFGADRGIIGLGGRVGGKRELDVVVVRQNMALAIVPADEVVASHRGRFEDHRIADRHREVVLRAAGAGAVDRIPDLNPLGIEPRPRRIHLDVSNPMSAMRKSLLEASVADGSLSEVTRTR